MKSPTRPQHLNKNKQKLIHLKDTPHTDTVRKQVNRASLPQTLAPQRWMLGFFCTALPVEPHSCRTLGCTWSTSSDTALSSGKYLQPEHARPCRHHRVKEIIFVRDGWMFHLSTLFKCTIWRLCAPALLASLDWVHRAVGGSTGSGWEGAPQLQVSQSDKQLWTRHHGSPANRKKAEEQRGKFSSQSNSLFRSQ